MEQQKKEEVSSERPLKEEAEPKTVEPVLSADELKSQIEKLCLELENEKKKNAEQSSRMKYLQADIINLQRQADRMVAEAKAQVKLAWILEIISIQEDLERAIEVATPKQEATIVDGLNMVLSKIENVLKSEDVQLIKIEHKQKFDPRVHEAVAFRKSESHEDGMIVSVVSNGYMIGGKVIKPTLVEVARNLQPMKTDHETSQSMHPDRLKKDSEKIESSL